MQLQYIHISLLKYFTKNIKLKFKSTDVIQIDINTIINNLLILISTKIFFIFDL